MGNRKITIAKTLYDRIEEYCKANGLSMTEKCEQWLRSALNRELYGDIPFGKLSDNDIHDDGTVPVSETKPIPTEQSNDTVTEGSKEQENTKRPTKRRL